MYLFFRNKKNEWGRCLTFYSLILGTVDSTLFYTLRVHGVSMFIDSKAAW